MSAIADSAETAAKIDEIVAVHAGQEGALLPILHDVQHAFGHVPEAAIPQIAHALNLTRAEVFGVVSFYHDYRDAPAGRHVIKFCRAEACQAAGGAALGEKLQKDLGVRWGETTPDGAVTLDAVYCLGLCSVAPAAMTGNTLEGRLDAEKVDKMIARCRS